MKDIVVCYKTEDNECDFHELVCLRHESPLAFLVEFEKKLIVCHEQDKEFCQARQEWMKERTNPAKVRGRKKIEAAKASYDEDMKKWNAKQPFSQNIGVKIAGKTFYCWNFYTKIDHRTGQYSDEYTLPEAYELQEWFDKEVKNEKA